MENEEKKVEGVKVVDTVVVDDPTIERDLKIAKLTEERDNYRHVALKRLGKLPGDAEFLEGADAKSGLTVEEIVKQQLIDREIASEKAAKDVEVKRIIKENSELKFALKNRPQGSSVGGDSGSSGLEVKDNVFNAQQIEMLRQRALRIKADPEKFIESAKKNLLSHR